MKKYILPVALVFGIASCGDSQRDEAAERHNEAMEEYHENQADMADDADLPALEEMHEDSAEYYDDRN